MPPNDRDLFALYWPGKGLDPMLPVIDEELAAEEDEEEEPETQADATVDEVEVAEAADADEAGPASGDGRGRRAEDIWGPGAARPNIAGPSGRPVTVPAAPARGARHRGAGDERAGGPDLRRMARHSYLQLTGTAFNAVLSLGLIILAAHKLGRAGTGALYVGIAVFMIATNLAELGADTGLVRMIPHYRALGRMADMRRLIAIALIPVFLISALLTVPLLLYSQELANLLGHTKHAGTILPYIRNFAYFLPVSAVSTVALTGARGFGTLVPFVAVENIGKPLVRPILLYAAIASGLGTTAVALSWSAPIAVGAVIGVPWLLYLARRNERMSWERGRPPARATSVGRLTVEFWKFASPRSLMGFFSTIVTWIDTILLSSLKATTDAGVYTAATRLIFPANMALTAIIAVIQPQLARYLAKKETRGDARTVYHTATSWLVAASWPFLLVLLVFAPLFLSMFGQHFVIGASVTMLLAAGSLLNMAIGPIGAVLLMGGHSLWGLFISVFSLALNVSLNLILIPKYGMVGSAIAWDASIVVNNVLPMIVASKLMKITPLGRGFFVAAAASLSVYGGIGLLTRAVFGTAVVPFLVYLGVATVLYVLLLMRFRRSLQLGALVAALPLPRRIRRRVRRLFEEGPGGHGPSPSGGARAGAGRREGPPVGNGARTEGRDRRGTRRDGAATTSA
jgi:O-antigen/teichoic acid export membrane protein